MKFKIYAGLAGGFGGAEYLYTEDFESEEKASEYAWEMAIESYESYEGLHGLRTTEEIKVDEEVEFEEALEMYEEERESWLDYYVKKVD